MARGPKLKVYRMPIGFHDAYVAAPSQKAAAEAWGTDAKVFARKEAELVTDPKLAEAPLAEPGKVIKRLRGTASEQLAALGGDGKREERGGGKRAAVAAEPKPRPSRAKLDEAEQALAEAEERHASELQALAEREAALARERRAVEKKQADEIARLGARRDKARRDHDEAMRRWRDSR